MTSVGVGCNTRRVGCPGKVVLGHPVAGSIDPKCVVGISGSLLARLFSIGYETVCGTRKLTQMTILILLL